MKTILSGSVLWSTASELQDRNKQNDLAFHVTGVKPFHCHVGEIFLTEHLIKIIGEDELEVRLEQLTQLYLGFDDYYNATLTKNFGAFWQPLRLTFNNSSMVYLIIDYNLISTKNKMWFNTLQELLS